MAYELIITEKPSSAEKIAAALADGKPVKKSSPQKVNYWELSHGKKDIIVASAVGHLFSVAEKEKTGYSYPSFDVEWELAADVNKDAASSKKYAMLIKKLAKDADEITVATDYDIEGETIGLTVIRNLCGRKDANRMKFSTVTAEDLKEAYAQKQPHIDWGQAEAGETRHFLDWYYGINLSRALMSSIKAAGSFMVLSAGRVQGPALKIIVDREKEIKAFVPEDFWQLELQSEKAGVAYSAWHEAGKIFDEKQAADIHKKCKGKPAAVEKVERNEYLQAPPTPFDLGTLQTEAFRCFGIKPKETLDHAQSLYSAGFISYPRTSSQQLDPKIGFKKILAGLAKQEAYKVLAERLAAKPSLTPNNGKKTDPAHPAIFPTGYVPKGLKERERKIYDLIVKRFLATFGDPAVRESMTVTVGCAGEKFLAKGARTVKPHWHEFYQPYVSVKEELLPQLTEGEDVPVKKLINHKKQTSPPKRYTQSSIITELEKRGLGTKATRADIVENLFKRGYCEGTSIQATDLGIKTVDALERFMPDIVDEALTRHFEDELEEIRERTKKPTQVLDEAEKELTKILKEFQKKEAEVGQVLLDAFKGYRDEKNTVGPCPVCKQGTLMVKFSRKNGGRFVGCDRYPDCEATFPLPKSGIITATGKACESCGTPMVTLRMARKKPEDVCFNPSCPARQKEMKEAQNAENGEKRVCPKCGKDLILRNGVYGAFFGCSGYPSCKHTENIKKKN